MRFEVDGKTANASTGGAAIDPGDPLVVFVHGAGGDRTMWALQTRYFAHHGWSVLAVDLPGHGYSDGPAPSSVEAYADWLAGAIRAVGSETAAVVGHSLGSYIALALAARQPELVTHVGMLGVAATMPVNPKLLAAAKADDPRAVDLITTWSFTGRSKLGGHPTPGTWITARNERVTERSLDGTLGSDLTAANLHLEAVANATRVVCPVLFLLGERDQMTPLKSAAELIAATGNTEVTVISRSGHMMMWEQPDAVIDALAGFLGAP